MSLPNTYQEVEYIESTGTQYIEIPFDNSNVDNNKYCFKYMHRNPVAKSSTILGNKETDYNRIGQLWLRTDGTTKMSIGDVVSNFSIFSVSTIIGVKIEAIVDVNNINNKYSVNYNGNTTYTNISFTGSSRTANGLKVFAGGVGNEQASNIVLYSCSIYSDDTLISDFVPCYRKSDEEIGLYDLVNDVFYTNAGTGKFLKGPSLTPIYNKLEYLLETKDLIKQAIIDKGQTITVQDTFRSYANKIAEIETGILSEQDVNFYDYDGTLVYSYTKNDFLELTAMPENPTHNGLTAQGWNWTLANAKTYVTNYNKLNIGQMYTTSDGSTRLYINLQDKNTLAPYLGLGVYGTITVDWGDNTTDTITGSNVSTFIRTQHNYSEPGTYVITLTPEENSSMQFSGNTNGSQIISYNENNLIANAYRNTLIKVEIGTGVTYASFTGNYSFYKCYSLETITIPNTITGILGIIFQNCNNLKYITIPSSITGIKGSFGYCRNLTHISIPKEVTSFGTANMSFAYCACLRNITLSDLCTEIPQETFSNCTALEYVILPASIATVGQSAFASCFSLKSVDLSSATSITTLSQSAFNPCYSLQEVKLPSSITTFAKNIFQSCQTLSHIIIPASLTSIGTYVFNQCISMRYYDFSNCSVIPTLENTNTFYNMPSDCKIIVPNNLYDSWITANVWSSFSDKIIKKSDWEV